MIQASASFRAGKAALAGRPLLVSLAVHAALAGLLALALALKGSAPAIGDAALDMSIMAELPEPLVKSPAVREKKQWVAPPVGATAKPQSVTESAEVETLEECPAPCPDREGDFIPAANAKQRPRWVGGFITRSDYPSQARREGLEGKVLVKAFIGMDGRVVEVRLLEGEREVFNEVVLRKVRQARFRPARDESGNPVPVNLIIPIHFKMD